MEAPAPKLENASTWAGVAVANLWIPVTVSQLAEDGSIHKSQIFGSKWEVVHAVKAFFVRSHQKYYIYKSTKTLLKLSAKGCPSARGVYMLRNERGMSYG